MTVTESTDGGVLPGCARDREKTGEPSDSNRARASGQLGNEGDERR